MFDPNEATRLAQEYEDVCRCKHGWKDVEKHGCRHSRAAVLLRNAVERVRELSHIGNTERIVMGYTVDALNRRQASTIQKLFDDLAATEKVVEVASEVTYDPDHEFERKQPHHRPSGCWKCKLIEALKLTDA